MFSIAVSLLSIILSAACIVSMIFLSNELRILEYRFMRIKKEFDKIFNLNSQSQAKRKGQS